MKMLTTALCGFAMLGTAAVTQAGTYDPYGGRTGNFYGNRASTGSCVDGTCGHPQCQNGLCTTGYSAAYSGSGTCLTANCGHAGCPDGACRFDNTRPQYGTANRGVSPTMRPVSSYHTTSSLHSTGYRPVSTCPGGVCPPPTRATTYPAVNHRPAAMPQYQVQRPSFFGLHF